MPIVVSCGQCERRYEVADELAGRTFRCKSCGAAIVTKASAEMDSTAASKSHEVPEQKAPATAKGVSKSDRSTPTEVPKAKPLESKSKPIRREPKVLDDLEVFDDDLVEEADDESPRLRSLKPSSSSSRRSKSRGPSGGGFSTKWLVVGSIVISLLLVGWWAFGAVQSFWKGVSEITGRWVELPAGDVCKVKLPPSSEVRSVIHPVSSAMTMEITGASVTAEVQLTTIRWQRSVGAGMDAHRIWDAVRDNWALPWGATEQEDKVIHDGTEGREFRGSKNRTSIVRAFANQYGLIVLRIRNHLAWHCRKVIVRPSSAR